MKDKAFLYWSGGKDSALALYNVQQQGLPVKALVTTVNKTTNRVAMHGVRRELLEQQAAAIGLPLYVVELPEMPGMEAYEAATHTMHCRLKEDGFTHAVFGDIFLEDLRRYREVLLARDGLQCLFPLWKMDNTALLNEFFRLGFKAVVVCTAATKLAENFCGRLLDESFTAALPPDVDACGENGEYHSFVFDGPLFPKPVAFARGEVVYKEYPSPVLRQVQDDRQQAQGKKDDCFSPPQPAAGFWFQDLRLS